MTKKEESLHRLYDALLQLNSREECARFLEDLCTIRELQDMSQRLEVAEMLRQGQNYQLISQATGASTATICRVSKCLNYGDGGYETVLSRLKEEQK